MEKILGHFHFVGRKERHVIQLITEHFSLIMQTVQELESLLTSARAGNWKNVEEVTNRVSELETEADGIHRDAVITISKGAFFSGTKEDFLSLMEGNDRVADAAKDAARILSETPIDTRSFLVLYEQSGATLDDLFGKLRMCVEILQGTLTCLESDAQLAVSKSLMVEKAEEDADEIKNALLKRIFSHKGDLEVLTLLQLRDFVLKLDDIADTAEDSSDMVISLVAKAQA